MDGIPEKVIREYVENDRDFAILEPFIATLKDKPVVFTCDPLRPAFDGLAVTGNISDMKSIFAAHVTDMANVDLNMMPKFYQKEDRKYVDAAYLDTIPPFWIIEVANVIAHVGMAMTDPFTVPDGYWRQRANREVKAHAKSLSTLAPTIGTASAPGESS
jgi:hypothetical protein